MSRLIGFSITPSNHENDDLFPNIRSCFHFPGDFLPAKESF